MPIDADTPVRPDPRLVPTLTQVVGRTEPEARDRPPVPPGDAAQPAPVAAVPARAEPAPWLLDEDLDRRLEAAITRVLGEQVPQLAARLRAIVGEELRAAAGEAWQRQQPGADDSGNP